MTVPALALANFQYKRYIDNLTEEEFSEAKDFVTTKWYGVFEMWEVLPQDVKFKKREVIFIQNHHSFYVTNLQKTPKRQKIVEMTSCV